MNENNPNIPACGNYSVDISQDDLIRIYTDKWVLNWCKKYHPEAFEEADKFLQTLAAQPSQEPPPDPILTPATPTTKDSTNENK